MAEGSDSDDLLSMPPLRRYSRWRTPPLNRQSNNQQMISLKRKRGEEDTPISQKKRNVIELFTVHVMDLNDESFGIYIYNNDPLEKLLNHVKGLVDDTQEYHLEVLDRKKNYIFNITEKNKPFGECFEHKDILIRIVTNNEVERSKNLINSYLALLGDEKTADVKFIFGDDEIHAHKKILSSRCDYFSRMFDNGMQETNQKEISIKNCNYDIFKMLLAFLYTNQLEIPEDQNITFTLHSVADLYGVIDLCSELDQVIIKRLKPNTVLDVIFGYVYIYPDLLSQCLDYINENFNEIFEKNSDCQFILSKYQNHDSFVDIIFKIFLLRRT